jgi:uncharacterized membrane protein YhaH (DUF805 family)
MNGPEVLPLWANVLFFVVFVGVFGPAMWAIVRILHRMGKSGWWILGIGLWPFMLVALALCRWPAFEEREHGVKM